MKNCPRCGSPQAGDALFCDTCGNPFPVEKKACPLCMAGFIISLVSFDCLVLMFVSCYGLNLAAAASVILTLVFGFISLASAIAGLVVSIKGTKKAKRQSLSGEGFGIAGIIISAVTGAVVIISTIIMVLFLGLSVLLISAIASSMGNNYKGPAVRYGNYDVFLTEKEDRACITKWYWSGDPEDNVLVLPGETPDGAKITAFGDYGAGPKAPRFEIEFADDIHNYCLTSEFKNSEAGKNIVTDNPYDPSYYGIQPGTEVHFKVLIFTVKLGKNIEQVNVNDFNKFFIVQGDDGIITIYRYYFTFDCDDENKNLYADNGNVYKRGSDSLEARQDVPVDTEPTVIVASDPDDADE